MTTPPPLSFFPPPPPPEGLAIPVRYEPLPLESSARDGGSSVRLLCWLVIILLVLFEVWANVSQDKEHLAATPATKPTTHAVKHAGAPEKPEADMTVAIGGRYIVAVNSWAQDQAKDSIPKLLAQVREKAKEPIDRIDLAIVSREVDTPENADKQFAELRTLKPLSPTDRKTIATLQKIESDGPHSLSEAERKSLVDYLDWFGKLALVHHLPANDPERVSLINDTHRLFITTVVAGVLFTVVIIAGIVLLVFAIVLGAHGRLMLRYRVPAPGSVYLEVFALYMVSFFILQLLLPLVVKNNPLQIEVGLLFALVPIALFWPIIRGETWQTTRMNLGWHCGEGVLKEMGAGIVAYLASLPLIALAFFVSELLIKIAETMHWVGSSPTHPIVHYLSGSPGTIVAIYLLASGCAPVLEETMFRGALLNHLRGRHGWWISSLIVSLIFAAIHPQGWTLIPTLGALAMSFAAMRQWRSSIIPSMTAHAINNGVVLTIALLMLR